jgi:hypothetical protein
MPLRERRRALLWATLMAVVIGFAIGWLTRVWVSPTTESRARDALDKVRERARQITR